MKATIVTVGRITETAIGICLLIGVYCMGRYSRKDEVARPLIKKSEAIERKGAHLDECEEKLARNSGHWVADGENCRVELDYRVITFSKYGFKGDWEELNGNKYLIGQGMDFMTNTGFYYIGFQCADESEMVLRKKTFSNPEMTWIDTVSFHKGEKNPRVNQ